MKLLTIPLLLLLGTGCIFKGIFGGGKDDDDDEVADLDTEPPFDCDGLDTEDDWEFIQLGYTGEEFAFDADGYVVTASDWSGAILQQDLDGDVEIIAPFQSDELAGVDLFPNGDILFADEGRGSLMRMTPGGVESLVASSLLSPNSVIVHPSGKVFTTAYDSIKEVFPNSGDKETLVPGGDFDLDGLTLSPNYDYLWFNEDDRGTVFRVPIDGSDDPELVAELPVSDGVELNGMTTDVCGNVYALRTDGRVTRVSPDGDTETFVHVERPGDMYTTAIHFGSGIGGWDENHIYIMDRFGGLFEVYVGIPGVAEPHL